jgi:hypothetical protein
MTTKKSIQNGTAHRTTADRNSRGQRGVAATGANIGENVQFCNALQKTLDKGAADVADQAKRYANNPPASQAGFVAEADHCATFNARKALGRSNVRAVREPNGNHGDFKIVKGRKVLVKGEMKYHATAEKTENAMRGYGDRQLVGPADQIDDIKDIAARKAAKNGASGNPIRRDVGREHEAVGKNAKDCIADGKTTSTPRTSKEAKRIAKDASKGKHSPQSTLPPLGESVKTAAKSGAKAGAVWGAAIPGVFSGVDNAQAFLDGQKDAPEALADFTVDVAKSATDGAAKGAAGSAATATATHLAGKVASPLAKRLLRSSGPAAAAIGVVETAKHAIDWGTGEIDGEEFAEKTVQTAATTAGGWGGAQAGAMLGGAVGGPPGAIVGAVVGGIFAAFGISSLFE